MNEFLTQDVLFPIIIGTCVFAILIVFIVLFVINYQKRQKEFENERAALKKALLETEIEIKEQTLTNISRELHDNIGQIASLIKINLNLLSSDLPETDKLKVEDSIVLIKGLIKDIKALSVSLKSENLQRFGLVKMISKDIERYKSIGDLSVDFESGETIHEMDAETEVILYRMSQEVFNNILKHAEASTVSVKVLEENKNLTFSFKDDGQGFNADTVELGSGLINLKERCKMIGAELKIESVINQGTLIEITLDT